MSVGEGRAITLCCSGIEESHVAFSEHTFDSKYLYLLLSFLFIGISIFARWSTILVFIDGWAVFDWASPIYHFIRERSGVPPDLYLQSLSIGSKMRWLRQQYKSWGIVYSPKGRYAAGREIALSWIALPTECDLGLSERSCGSLLLGRMDTLYECYSAGRSGSVRILHPNSQIEYLFFSPNWFIIREKLVGVIVIWDDHYQRYSPFYFSPCTVLLSVDGS